MSAQLRPLPPLAVRTKHHRGNLANDVAEGIRTLNFGANRFTSMFCLYYCKRENVALFLARDELKAYDDNGYLGVPWNAKSLHQLAIEVDTMQSELLASMKGELGTQEEFEAYVQKVMDDAGVPALTDSEMEGAVIGGFQLTPEEVERNGIVLSLEYLDRASVARDAVAKAHAEMDHNTDVIDAQRSS